MNGERQTSGRIYTPEGLQEAEATNFRIGLAALGETYGLVDEALGLYDRLGRSVGESGIRLSAATVATVAFLHGCRYALVKGVLELLRGHQNDSLMYLRNATEFAGFADVVRRYPERAVTWMNGPRSPETYKEYRDQFRSRDLFPRDDRLMSTLYSRYDDSSRQIHASLHSFAARLQLTPGVLAYAYFDVRDETVLVPMFVYTIQTHFGIIQVFARALSEALAHDRAAWELHYNAFDAALQTHVARWSHLLTPRSGPPLEPPPPIPPNA